MKTQMKCRNTRHTLFAVKKIQRRIQWTITIPSIHQTRRRSVLVHKWLTTAPAGAAHTYSKTCVKRPLSKRPEIGFQDQLSPNAGQKYCRMLQYFRPSLSYHLSLRTLFCLFLSGRFTHVLLYIIQLLTSISVDIRIYPPEKVIIHRGR